MIFHQILQVLLGIEQIHLAWTAVHEQLNDGLGARLEMRRLRTQIIRLWLGVSCQRRIGVVEIGAEQRRQGGAVQAARNP